MWQWCPDSFPFPTHFRCEINFSFSSLNVNGFKCARVEYLYVSCFVFHISPADEFIWLAIFAAAVAAVVIIAAVVIGVFFCLLKLSFGCT